MHPSSVHYQILSAPTRGAAIAVVELQGPLDTLFTRLLPSTPTVGSASLRSVPGIDDLLVARTHDRHAYLFPHAGPAIIQALAQRLDTLGAQRRPPSGSQAFPEAADEIERKALETIARAASPLAVDLLLDQPRRWRDTPAPPEPATSERSHLLSRLLDPPTVVAVGPSNVGKSTLLNTLAERSVSIVADEPHTTRDHVGALLDLAGLVVRYLDTPGLSRADDNAQQSAQILALDAAARADMLLLCADAADPDPDPYPPVNASPSAQTLRIAMRSDLHQTTPAFPHDLAVSTLDLTSIARLAGLIRDWLIPPEVLADPSPWRFWNESDDPPSTT